MRAMANWTYTSFREQVGAGGGRVFQSVASRPNWPLRLAAFAAAAVILAIALLVLIPAAVIFVLAVGIARGLNTIRTGFRRLVGRPDTEGRENVRVVVRQHR